KVSSKRKHSLLYFILFPAISMMLGWGLRGFIGGGPYGAMIPGAMVTFVICMLLDIPLMFATIVVVFGTAGTAMGGEMTYGQTIGFLRNPERYGGVLREQALKAAFGDSLPDYLLG